jgi:type IX secretion system PorP/SprF family membrane protein
MYKRWTIWLLGMMGILTCAAQQDPMYSQYMFNHLNLNPAYAGKDGYMSSALLFRQQWAGINGAPTTQNLVLHGPSANDRHGFGLSIYNDQIGVSNNSALGFSYAFRIHLGTHTRLALGLSGSLTNYRADFGSVRTGSDINPGQPVDPSFAGRRINLWIPNAGTGLFFHSRRFYAGASAPRLLTQSLADQNTPSQAKQARHFFLTTGIMLGEEMAAVKFRPSMLVKYQPASGLQFDLNAHFLFVDRFWLGASFRTEDALVLMAEWNVAQWLRIGYAYDYARSALSTYTTGSHEFMLGVDLNFKKAMVSPRYF